MTQEEKQLLIQVLCEGLSHGVMVRTSVKIKALTCEILSIIIAGKNNFTILPYLRPMSSMTEEEKIELCIRGYAPDEMKTIDEKLYVIQTNAKNAADFYNEHHLDYRGLIPMGLALEAPEGMYKKD